MKKLINGFDVFELFDYRDDGNLIWRSRPLSHFDSLSSFKTFNTRFSGKIAGTKSNKSGYAEVRINQKSYMVHRIIFFMFNDLMPECVDHINMDKCDNRIENLRAATKSQNGINAKIRKNNKSGYTGVSYCKVRSMWKSAIKKNGKSITIGYFDNVDEAAVERKRVEKQMFGDFSND